RNHPKHVQALKLRPIILAPFADDEIHTRIIAIRTQQIVEYLLTCCILAKLPLNFVAIYTGRISDKNSHDVTSLSLLGPLGGASWLRLSRSGGSRRKIE